MASIWPSEDAYIWGPLVSVLIILIANVLTYALNPNSWVHKHVLRRCGVPRMFFASNRADHVDKRALPQTYWAFDLLEPAHVVQSYILSTPLLLVLHALTFIYFLVTVIVDVVIEWYLLSANRGPYGGWVTFLTNWSITLLGLAGLVAFIDTARHAKRERHARKSLKAAQPQVQRSSLSQMGNLDDTNVISAWRDYQYASRTNSLLNLSGSNSPQGTTPGTLGSNTPASSTTVSPRTLQNRQAGPGLDPGLNPNGGPAANAWLSPNNTKQQLQNGLVAPGLDQGLADDHRSADRGVQLAHVQHGAGGPADAPAGYRPTPVNPTSNAVHPNPDSAVAKTGCGPCGKKRRVAVADSGDAARVRDGNAANGADTIVMVQDDGYSRKPTIKGIDEWDWLSGTHCILMEIATTAAFFVSFWFWVGIVGIGNSSFDINGGTLMAHAGNVVVALLQILLTRQPLVSVHFQVLLWYATLYEIFLWIYGEVSGVWRYNLDWQVSKPAGAFALIPVITFIMFLLWFFAAVIRERAFIPAATKVVRHHKVKKQQRHEGHQHVEAV